MRSLICRKPVTGQETERRISSQLQQAAEAPDGLVRESRISFGPLENHFQCEPVLARIVARYSRSEFHTLEHWAALQQALNLGRALCKTRYRDGSILIRITGEKSGGRQNARQFPERLENIIMIL